MTAPTLYLRRAVDDDITTLYLWRGETVEWLAVAHPGTDQWRAPYPRANLEAKVERGEMFMAALSSGGPAVATITSSTEGDPALWTPVERTTPAVYLSKLNVVRNQGGRGIGAALMAWAGNDAARRGIGLVRFDVFSANTDLQLYYLKLGYRYLRTVPDAPLGSGTLFETAVEVREDVPVVEEFVPFDRDPTPAGCDRFSVVAH